MKHIYGRTRIYTGDLFILHDKKQESWFISHAVAFISNFSTKTTTWKLLILKMKTTTKTMKQPTTTKTRTTTKPNEPERQPMGSHSSLKKKKRFSFRIVTPINLPLPEQFQVFYCPYFVEHLMFTQCSPR